MSSVLSVFWSSSSVRLRPKRRKSIKLDLTEGALIQQSKLAPLIWLSLSVKNAVQASVRMNYIGKFLTNFKDFYNEINSATLTGAIDVIVVQQEDGSFVCSPFHVRFGKIGVLRSREKVVDIEINGEPVDIHMKLGESGEAFFVEEMEDVSTVPSYLATSPIPPYPDIRRELAQIRASEFQKPSKRVMEGREPSPIVVVSESLPKNESLDFTAIGSASKQFKATSVLPGQVTAQPPLLHSTEFKPIKDESSDGKCDASTECNIDASADTSTIGSKTSALLKLAVLTPTDKSKSAVVKRKRKRRVKRTRSKDSILVDAGVGTHSSGGSKESGVASLGHDEDIFQMEDQSALNDDDDEADEPLGSITKSTSLPLGSLQKGEETEAFLSSTLANGTWPTKSRSLPMDYHPYSDGDVTPSMTPGCSRPSTPKSDTEYETSREAASQTDMSTSQPVLQWTWGELPVHTPTGKSVKSVHYPPPTNTPSSMNPGVSLSLAKTAECKVFDQFDSGSISQSSAQEEGNQSMLGGMFRFMRTSKKMRHKPESEGIYLSELNSDELDPEVAALYFPRNSATIKKQPHERKREDSGNSSWAQNSGSFHSIAAHKDDDVESGNGSSLPQSPNSIEGAVGGMNSTADSDSDERHSVFDYSDLALSMCGGLSDAGHGITRDRFAHSLITYDDLADNPDLLSNPDLVVRINGKYYNWQTCSPQLVCLMFFRKPLPERVSADLKKIHMPKKNMEMTASALKKAENKSYSWFSWRRGSAQKTAEEEDPGKKIACQVESTLNSLTETVVRESTIHSVETESVALSLDVDQADKPASTSHSLTESKDQTQPEPLHEIALSVDACPVSPVDVALTSQSVDTAENVVAEDHTPIRSGPIGIDGSHVSDKQMEPRYDFGGHVNENDSDLSEKPSTAENGWSSPGEDNRVYRKTLRLSSEQIAKLNLTEGANEVVFSVTTAYQGTTRCRCHIYLWRYDDKIVISDIDGTITKSDVLGHILPIIGKDWAQSGVAQLFSKIRSNGYKFLYLSARAIGQAHITREYLKSIRQGDVCMPDGPLLLSPSSLISALHREVIEKKPEEFKISCLRDIQALFDQNPFYAGYGNKINDVWAYRAMGIPMSRIFTINHKGELKHELTQTFQSSYNIQSSMVDHVFPPLRCSPGNETGKYTADFEVPDEYSSFTFWRPPIPSVSLNFDDLSITSPPLSPEAASPLHSPSESRAMSPLNTWDEKTVKSV